MKVDRYLIVVAKSISTLAVIAALVANSPDIQAQQGKKISVIGVLRPGSPPDPLVETFVHGLADLGYKKGYNVRIEYQWARGTARRIQELATELDALKVDLIFAPIRLASKLRSELPIQSLSFLR